MKGKHETVFDILEARQIWTTPYSKKLGDGLVEIRIRGEIQHRILGYFSPEKGFTILLICTHKGRVYSPRDAIKTARKRMKLITEGKANAFICKRPEAFSCPC